VQVEEDQRDEIAPVVDMIQEMIARTGCPPDHASATFGPASRNQRTIARKA